MVVLESAKEAQQCSPLGDKLVQIDMWTVQTWIYGLARPMPPNIAFHSIASVLLKKKCEGTAGKIDTLFSLLKICFLLFGWHMGLIITEINGALACLHVCPACRPRTAKLLTLSFLQGPWKSWWLLRVILVGQETPGKGDSCWKPPCSRAMLVLGSFFLKIKSFSSWSYIKWTCLHVNAVFFIITNRNLIKKAG